MPSPSRQGSSLSPTRNPSLAKRLNESQEQVAPYVLFSGSRQDTFQYDAARDLCTRLVEAVKPGPILGEVRNAIDAILLLKFTNPDALSTTTSDGRHHQSIKRFSEAAHECANLARDEDAWSMVVVDILRLALAGHEEHDDKFEVLAI